MSLIHPLKRAVMAQSRERKLEHFYRLFGPGQTVLDVGVSAKVERRFPLLNFFLKTYRYAPETYTGLGIDDLTALQRDHPDFRLVQYGGGRFPFEDQQFDWIFCNAVVEHVGTPEDQLHFVREMLRVARNVFFTTPNKYFPVESHTNILFLHWFDEWFYRWCRSSQGEFDDRNLRLLSRRSLWRLMERSGAQRVRIQPNRVLGLTMTFTVVAAGV